MAVDDQHFFGMHGAALLGDDVEVFALHRHGQPHRVQRIGQKQPRFLVALVPDLALPAASARTLVVKRPGIFPQAHAFNCLLIAGVAFQRNLVGQGLHGSVRSK